MRSWRRWLRRWGRRGATPLVLATFLLCMWMAPVGMSYDNYADLDEVASHFAGKDVSIMCLSRQESLEDPVISMWGASGYVKGKEDLRGRWHPERIARFAYGICERLEDLMHGDASHWSARSIAWAVLVLAHETGHLKDARFSPIEADTECWAIQHIQAFGRRMGVQDLSLLQILANEQHRMLPEVYQSDCALPLETPK